MGSKGNVFFFFSKHPYYPISGFPHQFGCLQTPTGWLPIYISLHTTRNTHPTGEMSSVWEDCLSLLHLQTLVMSPTFLIWLQIEPRQVQQFAVVAHRDNLQLPFTLQTMRMSHELPHEEILRARSTGFSCAGAFAHMELGVPHPAEPHC